MNGKKFFNANTDFVDFYEYEALKGAKKTLANGYVLTTEDQGLQAFFDNWVEENDFMSYMFAAEKLMRHYGRAVLVLLYSSEKQKVMPNIGIPWIITDVGSVNFMGGVNSLKAQIWLKMHSDVLANFTRATLTRKKTILEFYKDEIQSIGGTEEPPLDERTPKESNYDLPFVPVVDCINLPWYNAYATNLYNAYPDWRPVEGTIKIINKLMQYFMEEIEANQTRVFYNGTEGDQNIVKRIQDAYIAKHDKQGTDDFVRSADLQQEYVNDIKNVKKMLGKFLINIPTKGLETPNKLVEILQANPIFQSYSDAIDYWLQFFMNGCGLSHDTKDGSVNTATETMVNTNDESTDLSVRRRLRNKYYTNFFMKLCIMSKDPRVAKFNEFSDFINENNERIFNFQINDEKTKLTLDEKQMLLTEYQSGVLTLEDYVMKTQGLTQAEAKTKAEQLKKEQDEKAEDELNMQLALQKDDNNTTKTQENDKE